MTWRAIFDECQYFIGGFMFIIGTSGLPFGMSLERSTNVMVSGVGLAVLAYMRQRRLAGQVPGKDE